MSKPTFPNLWKPQVDAAANSLRALALDEGLKARIAADQHLTAIAKKVSARYIGGETVGQALDTITRIAKKRKVTVDYMGESCRDRAFASQETEVFVELTKKIGELKLPCSISLDLSHIGSLIEHDFAFANAKKIATACRDIDTEMIISAEGSDRTDLTHALYTDLCKEFTNVGMTVQARLHRTEQDIETLLQMPGKIRLVKGAYLETEEKAFPRNSEALEQAYRRFAQRLIQSGHSCSIATHDKTILTDLHHFISDQKLHKNPFEFEMLLGLWDDQLDEMTELGYPTREYVVFGKEWFLYVCNRIAEEPIRLYQALNDVAS
jgi:proline dehydrogenase